MMISMKSRLVAEFLGTMWLVLGGCGSAVLAAKVLSTDATPVNMGIVFVGVALAFGSRRWLKAHRPTGVMGLLVHATNITRVMPWNY